MDKNLVAKATATIGAPLDKVWDALVNPDLVQRYMFGARVSSDWKEGRPITWTGEWKGKPFEDKGVILRIEPRRRLTYSHFSPLSGLADTPENHHTVDIALADRDGRTLVSLSQDNNRTEEEREHSEKNWQVVLEGLRKVLED